MYSFHCYLFGVSGYAVELVRDCLEVLQGQVGQLRFAPTHVDDAWGASIGANKKEGDPGKNDCHARDVTGR